MVCVFLVYCVPLVVKGRYELLEIVEFRKKCSG